MREFLQSIYDYKGVAFCVGVFIIIIFAMILEFFRSHKGE
jgi:hypothetical protein